MAGKKGKSKGRKVVYIEDYMPEGEVTEEEIGESNYMVEMSNEETWALAELLRAVKAVIDRPDPDNIERLKEPYYAYIQAEQARLEEEDEDELLVDITEEELTQLFAGSGYTKIKPAERTPDMAMLLELAREDPERVKKYLISRDDMTPDEEIVEITAKINDDGEEVAWIEIKPREEEEGA
jgi:hypothetical protein